MDFDATEVIADSYKGKRLNSPNDVVVKSDGSVWFTDPPTVSTRISKAILQKANLAGVLCFANGLMARCMLLPRISKNRMAWRFHPMRPNSTLRIQEQSKARVFPA